MIWLEFLISAAMIVLAGIKLTVYADRLCDRLNLGKALIGVVLLGFVTSLPEAISSLTAIVQLHANDLAIGNLLGSNAFNPMIFVVMDLVYRQAPVSTLIHPLPSHNISALYAILLTGIVALELFLSQSVRLPFVGSLTPGMIAVSFLFFVGMKRLADAERVLKTENEDGVLSQSARAFQESLPQLIGKLFVIAIVVVVAAMWLAQVADKIAWQTGLGESFVGSLLLAIVTSLPEVIVSVSALKIGEIDLAIGNVFGSNMVNMFILVLCGIFFKGGILLSSVSASHALTAVLAMILTGVAWAGVYHKGKGICGLAWDSVVMIIIFLAGQWLIYQ